MSGSSDLKPFLRPEALDNNIFREPFRKRQSKRARELIADIFFVRNPFNVFMTS